MEHGVDAGTPANPVVSGDESAAPGVLLLGIQAFLFSAFLSPTVLQKLTPEIFYACPRRVLAVGVAHVLGVLLSGLMLRNWRALGKSWAARVAFIRIPAIGGVALSLGTLLLLLSGQEVVFKVLNTLDRDESTPPHVTTKYSEHFFLDDPLLGCRGIPFMTWTQVATHQPENTPLYEATYHLDQFGYRVVPQDAGPKSEHLATFGCSFTFGEGVEDDETLPAQLACMRPDTAVYSFAMPGYSTGQAALQIQTGATERIEEPAGAAVYLFMSDHVNRVLPTLRKIRVYTAVYPAFELNARGEPNYLGALGHVYSRRIALYDAASFLNFSKWARLEFPLYIPEKDYDLCVALLDVARREYQVRFPGNEFYVIVDPVCHIDFDFPALERALNRRKLKWLDPKGLFGQQPWKKYHYPTDGHPTPEAHAMLAEWFWAQFPDGLLAGPRKVVE